MSQVFPYATDLEPARFWEPFGVRPSNDGVTLTVTVADPAGLVACLPSKPTGT